MNLQLLAERLIAGQISVAEWQAAMREFIRTIHRQAAIVAMGGAENVTFSVWGYVGHLVKNQYRYLDGFAQDIINNPDAWLNGRLLVRMRLYERAEWGAFEELIRRHRIEQGFTEEMRELGVADHCDDCLQWAGKWAPIGTLPRIGESVCRNNCHCVFKYRTSTGDDMLFAPGLAFSETG